MWIVKNGVLVAHTTMSYFVVIVFVARLASSKSKRGLVDVVITTDFKTVIHLNENCPDATYLCPPCEIMGFNTGSFDNVQCDQGLAKTRAMSQACSHAPLFLE